MILLIVEDNPSVRKLIRQVASEVADRIVECEDGIDSLGAYAEHLPDVVLMDVRMPRMDGLAATRLLIQHDPDAKIVIVTDYDDEELRKAAREAGACAFVFKQNLTDVENAILEVFSPTDIQRKHRLDG